MQYAVQLQVIMLYCMRKTRTLVVSYQKLKEKDTDLTQALLCLHYLKYSLIYSGFQMHANTLQRMYVFYYALNTCFKTTASPVPSSFTPWTVGFGFFRRPYPIKFSISDNHRKCNPIKKTPVLPLIWDFSRLDLKSRIIV